MLWTGGEDISLPGMLVAGALVWVLFCAAQIAAHGVVLDEVVEPAQVIAGAVRYPPGHPYQIFYSQAYCLPNYLWAALWKLTPNAEAVSAPRNFLFVFLNVFVPFAFATLLTRRPLWGHLAAVLTVTEAGLKIQGVYPLWVFPNFYSHGQIGLEVGALVVALILARCWRTGGFLLGLLPALHAAMAAVVWPWSALYLLFSSSRPRGRDLRKLIAAGCWGLAICVAFGVFLLARGDSGVQPPYEVRADGGAILRNFTAFSDYHRQPFEILSPGYGLSLVAFFTLGALLWRGASRHPGHGFGKADRDDLLWVLLFGGVAWAWVYGTQLIQWVNGAFPQIFEQLMPYRFANFSAILLLPLTAAALAAAFEEMPNERRDSVLAWVILVLGVAGLLQLCEGISFDWLRPQRVAFELLFFVWGLVCATDAMAYWKQPERRRVSLAAAIVLAATLFIAASKSNGIVFLAGFFTTAAFLAVAARVTRQSRFGQRLKPLLTPALACVFLIVCLAALPRYRLDLFRWDRMTFVDFDLKNWLDKNAAPDEIVLTPVFPRAELQIKTGHPVLMEIETIYVMTYMPRLAPVVGAMSRDLYGLDYSDPGRLRGLATKGRVEITDAWISVWKRRTRDEWETLGRRYNFRFVLSLRKAPLNLPESFRSANFVIYTIPASTAAGRGDPGGLAGNAIETTAASAE